MSDENSQKFLRYKARILAINGGNTPDRLTAPITVPEFRGYSEGEVIPAGTLLSEIIQKEFNSAPVTYTITISSTGAGTVSPTGTQTVYKGASLTITATPDAGSQLKSFKVDGANKSNPYTLTNIQANHRVEVEFEAIPVTTHTITATAGANGSISPSGQVSVNDGASQNFTIAADTGYRIKDVKVDGASQGAISTYTFTNVQEDHTIEATFKETPVVVETYTVVVTDNTTGLSNYGTISPAAGTHTVNVGTTTTVTATPNSGYKIKTLTLDGVDKTSPFTINGVKDQTYNVVVEFEKIPTGKLYTLLTGVKPAATDITDEFAEEEFDDTVDSQDFHIHGGTTLGTKVSIAYPASKGDLVSVTFDAWAGGIPDGGYLAKCTVTDVTKDGVAYKFLTTGSLSKNADVRLTLSWK